MANSSRSVISMFVGQCGIQTGVKIWELLAYEHDICPDGTRDIDAEDYGNIHSFFIETLGGKYIPKALFFDTDNKSINEFEYLPHKEFFNRQYTACNNQDSNGVFSVAQKQINSTPLLKKYKKTMRVLMEQCDLTCAGLTYSALGGGTGSAGGLVANELYRKFQSKSPTIWTSLLPNNSIASSPADFMNASYALADPSAITNVDLHILYDNEALYEIAKECMTCPINFSHLNMLVARMVSCMTGSLRMPSELTLDVRDLVLNLVPRRQFKYVFPQFAPGTANNTNYRLAVGDIVAEIFKSSACSFLSKTKSDKNLITKYINIALLFRGDVQPQKIYESLNKTNKNDTDRFVEYLPCKYTIGINTDLLLTPESWPIQDPCRACCAITHDLRVSENFQVLADKIFMVNDKEFFNWNFDVEDKNRTSDAGEFLANLIDEYLNAFSFN